MGAGCFRCTDSVKIFDTTDSFRIYNMIADRSDYLKPRGTITADSDVKNGAHVLTFCLDDFYKETIRLLPSGACLPSPIISEFDYDDSLSIKENLKMSSDSIFDLVQRLWYFWSLIPICVYHDIPL